MRSLLIALLLTLLASPSPLFDDISPLVSLLDCVHENAMSSKRHLPESLGPGCAFLDYDGDSDLFVTPYGTATLYRNNGDGTFSDVTKRAGVAAPGWTASEAWLDYDGDGRLDLFACQFVDYSSHLSCGDNQLGRNYYYVPRLFKPMASMLYRNLETARSRT